MYGSLQWYSVSVEWLFIHCFYIKLELRNVFFNNETGSFDFFNIRANRSRHQQPHAQVIGA